MERNSIFLLFRDYQFGKFQHESLGAYCIEGHYGAGVTELNLSAFSATMDLGSVNAGEKRLDGWFRPEERKDREQTKEPTFDGCSGFGYDFVHAQGVQ